MSKKDVLSPLRQEQLDRHNALPKIVRWINHVLFWNPPHYSREIRIRFWPLHRGIWIGRNIPVLKDWYRFLWWRWTCWRYGPMYSGGPFRRFLFGIHPKLGYWWIRWIG